MLSEGEAKKKWCPKVRVTAGLGGAGCSEWHTNRPSHAEVHEKGFDRCIGSACMAWRWSGVRVEEKLIPTKDYDAKNQAKADGWRYEVTYDDDVCLFVRAKSDAPEVGYCGLAGAPQ